jgi:hypothetical protein
MTSNPLSQWLAMSKSSMAMFRQLAESAGAGLPTAAGSQSPGAQAQVAELIKSTLEMGQQWQDMQASAMTAMFKTQLASLDAGPSFVSLQNLMELHQVLADDLSSQRYSMLKGVTERASSCVEDLHKTSGQDDMAIVLSCFLEDLNAHMKEHTAQTFTVLNSAKAASTILTHKALDGLIAGQARA